MPFLLLMFFCRYNDVSFVEQFGGRLLDQHFLIGRAPFLPEDHAFQLFISGLTYDLLFKI